MLGRSRLADYLKAVPVRMPRWRRRGADAPQREEPVSFAIATPFRDDPTFRRAYAAGEATGSWWGYDVEWRASIICWAALQGRSLDGDFVEVGVHRGGYARMVVDYVGFRTLAGKSFYLIDTYCGIPAAHRTGAAALFDGVYDDCHENVLATFAPFETVRVVRGAVPEVLGTVRPERVAFLSIDLNSAEPSADALEHFWPLMVPGAVAVLDDYNFELFADQRAVLDAAAGRLGAPILALPSGQGLMVKR
jgi:O-methyltransferase